MVRRKLRKGLSNGRDVAPIGLFANGGKFETKARFKDVDELRVLSRSRQRLPRGALEYCGGSVSDFTGPSQNGVGSLPVARVKRTVKVHMRSGSGGWGRRRISCGVT
jgi:hypothetical protein